MMDGANVYSEYLRWMYDLVCDNPYARKGSYTKLISYLDSIEFYYSIPMDGNRYEDGVDLRYKFGRICDIPDHVIAEELDNRSCSVLEMMIALCIRCEDQIMDNPSFGNRTAKWFWLMLHNLGLDILNDSRFNRDYADIVMNRFLNRRYEYNGEGGLFVVKHPKTDMAETEIWYQMAWYLSEYFEEGNE